MIHEINSHLCEFWIQLYDQVLQLVSVDMALLWEDMCYKNGPLISPAMFETFLLPYYRRLCRFFLDHGIKVIFVDTDGDAWKLIPLFMSAGVTGLYPMEVAAGMDVASVREAFPNLQMIGGVDKRALVEGKEAIDLELETKILPTVLRGGYVPTVDHLVPPDVPWPNFLYYRERLKAFLDRGR